MKLRLAATLLMLLGVGFVTLLSLRIFAARPSNPSHRLIVVAQVHSPAGPARQPGQTDHHQVRAGTPQAVAQTPFDLAPRYRYRYTEYANWSKLPTLSITDTQTGQVIPLGDATGALAFGAQSNDYFAWNFVCNSDCPTLADGLYVYVYAAQKNIFLGRNSVLAPNDVQLAGDWIAYTRLARLRLANLFATNLKTQETLTLTNDLSFDLAVVRHALSERLIVWVSGSPESIDIYDLADRHIIASINPNLLRPLPTTTMTMGAGDTVVTWDYQYGYDIVTSSYFTFSLKPPDWQPVTYADWSPVREKDRILYWSFKTRDGTEHRFSAPLIDASPSVVPCVEGQNLVQNGDLENVATHNVWQQSSNPSALIVNDLPPNSPQAGQWAIRLGRYSNAQPTIQQTLNIPSGVKHISLAFDVRASSWDIWGGDQLQIDLIDPITNQSILATPVQWTNRQLASGGWIPLQVEIQAWPGIDTPLYLVFRAQTDWAFPTDFTVDNIRFTTACQ